MTRCRCVVGTAYQQGETMGEHQLLHTEEREIIRKWLLCVFGMHDENKSQELMWNNLQDIVLIVFF